MGVSAALSALLRLTETKVRGPSPSFDRVHLLLAFLMVGASGTVGRAALAKRVGLGEGSARTVLKRLRSSGYAEVDASGCHLTATGLSAYANLTRRLPPPLSLDGSRLTVGRSQVALVVRGGGRLVKGGIEQRDSAVRAGASGATTYVMKGDRFTVPGGSSNCERDFPSAAWTQLRSGLEPRDGDAVILCGSGDETTANLGALSAALMLL